MSDGQHQRAARDPAIRAHTRAYRYRLRAALAQAVDRATTRGEIRAGDRDARAAVLLSSYYGVMVTAASDPGGSDGSEMIAGLRALLDDWATGLSPGAG